MAETELHECHETYRAVTDQVLKTVSFLATADAALLAVAVEQQAAVVLGTSAIVPFVAYGIIIHLGRQFGTAVVRGALLERRLAGVDEGYFWMHLRSGTPDLAEGLEHLESGETSVRSAPVLAPAMLRVVPLVVMLQIAAMPLAVVLGDWGWT